jgi:hypothetical protein
MLLYGKCYENAYTYKRSIVQHLEMMGGDTFEFGRLERANLNNWRIALSKGPNRVGRCISSLTWGRKHIQFPKRRVFFYLEFRTMDKA